MGILESSIPACMNSNQTPLGSAQQSPSDKPANVHVPTPKFFMPVFLTVIISTLIYIGFQLTSDLAHVPAIGLYSMILLATALFIALGFEFVNGFHDTANAVATVIYTKAMPPHLAVVASGIFNFLGVVLGGLAADLRVGAGAQTARELAAHVELHVCVAHEQRLGVGVDRDELDSLEPDFDHPVDGVDATAADADDLDNGQIVLG